MYGMVWYVYSILIETKGYNKLYIIIGFGCHARSIYLSFSDNISLSGQSVGLFFAGRSVRKISDGHEQLVR